MTDHTAVIVEVFFLVLIYAASAILARPVRRRTDPDRVGFGGVVHVLLQPALVLVLSFLAVQSLGLWPAGSTWLAANEAHVTAWQVFWLTLLVLGVCEAMARQIVAARGQTWPVPDLLEDILRALVTLLVAFGVLRLVLGWNIGPLLASTALVTAVMGFALQGVLGNLLAGMSLHLTRSVMQGDWVSIDGREGRVKRTNWRETRLTTLGGHELVLPNSLVAGSVVHNLNKPTPNRRHDVLVGASYSDEPDLVIATLEAAAREVPEVLEKPAPVAMITSFADYGINYGLYFWSRQYHRRGLINGQVSRHIWYKFKRAGIEIPFPMSDKLLNDFMTVVYNQRKLEPEAADQAVVVRDLLASDLHRRLCADDVGRPLLTADDWARLAPLVSRHLYTHGETLMRQGEAGDTLHVLVRGRLQGRIAATDAGQPEVTFTVEAGAVIGEMSLLAGAARSATLVTETGCEVLTLDGQAFAALLALRPDMPERLADLAARRVAANREAADQARDALAACPIHQQERAGILSRLLGFLGR